MGKMVKALLWIYMGILFTVVEVMAFLFWKMALSKDHTLVVGEPNDILFYVELFVLTFAAVFTAVFSYLVTLGTYRIEIQNKHGLTREEAKKARDNYITIEKLKEKMKDVKV